MSLSSSNCDNEDCIFYMEPSVDWIFCDFCERNKKCPDIKGDYYNNNPSSKWDYFDPR